MSFFNRLRGSDPRLPVRDGTRQELLAHLTPAGRGTACLVLCLVLAFLAACAPRDISSDAARVDAEYYGKGGPDVVSDMRYPIAGVSSSKERYFYRLSQPAIFESVQHWRTRQFLRGMNRGADGAVNPEHPSYREVPRERSPFRQ